ncbi:LamB/YcsF family protein [Bacillus sp. JCM 19034]|uniref:LamB/YcsF family protein n=1 Tax=Bacillus sp. JCM 19034 TaxID=1481928 RepID=UPI0007835B1C|nr:5-oxoprolinase subunit PxpA [Bacillus sp. JCM 19034]
MLTVDLNSDIGESFGVYQIGNDHELIKAVTSVNIACGYHAGDHNTMAQTVKISAHQGVQIGAHPGYQDVAGFGRRFIQTSLDDIYHMVVYQISALKGFCSLHQTALKHVKPHGALYNEAAINPEVASAIAQAVADCDASLILYGLSGSELVKAGQEKQLKVANEVFADRTYLSDGTLTPRHLGEKAMITNSKLAVAQVLTMIKEQKVKSIEGKWVPIKADTVCIHGDNEDAIRFGKELRRALAVEGVQVVPYSLR